MADEKMGLNGMIDRLINVLSKLEVLRVVSRSNEDTSACDAALAFVVDSAIDDVAEVLEEIDMMHSEEMRAARVESE